MFQKAVVIGAIGLTGLYYIGLNNPGEDLVTVGTEQNGDQIDDVVEYEEDPQLNAMLEFMKSLGIGLGTDLAVRALWRGGKVAVKSTTKAIGNATARATGRAVTKAATTAATKAAATAATKAATSTVTKVATEAASSAVTKAATSAAASTVTKAATTAATTTVTKAATTTTTKVAAEAATTAATKAGTTVVAKATTQSASAAADAARASKAAASAAKSAKGASMISKLKGTPADLLMMIISQILIATLDLDPENFKPCENGEFDMNSFPDWAKAMISAIPFLGDVFDLIGNKLCFKGGCAVGQENFMGLCYEKCREGFQSDAGEPFTCFKQYPDFQSNGMAHTYIHLTKKMETVVGDMLSECPAGSERHGALCYPTCKAGYSGVLDRCWASIHKVNTVGRLPDKAGCPNGWRDDGTSCWEDLKTTGGGCRGGGCHTGYFGERMRGAFGEDWGPKLSTKCDPITCDPIVTTGCGCIKLNLFQRQSCGPNEDMIDGLCYNKCPAGMEHVPGAPYDCRTIGEISYARGAGSSMKCKDGYTQDGALCYKPRDGWRLLAGTYSQNCPAGANDIGVACEREKYYRPAGSIPLIIKMKGRKD